ncbi:TetR/AcrR family transcriptional regulator [Anaerobacillus sp. CMMVII]|uniref:TetR/AcrR family transcriptional regulator n=1 Tax=Anaerobacillus sp. CMMVII TaxID=2755588 RepID=UPI0021B7FFA9|nr:TetR/AcrR family transcriptional regulator [Anaerobacillus sp. CMMVII]MCT8138760.1 TetR/AcrR family transcriptional regulator [Anaerobacillus sp. CMMVII]
MARRKVEKTTLFSATESLLIEQGYRGFHFKSLSERLKIGRSTLYEYYTSKEELITDYLVHMLDGIIEECSEISKTDAVGQLKEILKILLKYSQLHQIVLVIPFIDPHHSSQVEMALANLKRDHDLLYDKISSLIEVGKSEKTIRSDIETAVIASMIFNAIQVPNSLKINEEKWSEKVLEILFTGIGSNK